MLYPQVWGKGGGGFDLGSECRVVFFPEGLSDTTPCHMVNSGESLILFLGVAREQGLGVGGVARVGMDWVVSSEAAEDSQITIYWGRMSSHK